MSVNHASSASAEAGGRHVTAPRTIPRRIPRMAVAAAAGLGWLGIGLAIVIFGGGLVVQGVRLAMALVPRAIVWLALAAQSGADWWSIAGRAGGAVAATITSSDMVWWLIGMELLGVAALVGLQRVLREEMRDATSEEEKQ